MDASETPESPLASAAARHSERRSIILCAIGAIGGLAIAGAGLFTAQGTRIAGVPAEDVAIVNQVPVLMSDYVALFEATEGMPLAKGTPAQKRKILDQMIREELYVQRGVELGLPNDIIEVRQALVSAVEAQQAIDGSASQPEEETLKSFYRQQPEKYADEGRITLTDMIAPSMDQARAAITDIRAGKSVAAAAAAHGLQPSGKMIDGEEYYFAAKIHIGDALFDAARRVPAGKVSDPVQAPDGIHVMAVSLNIPPVPAPYDRIRDKVLSDYRADKIARMQSGADAFLRKRADVQIAPGFE